MDNTTALISQAAIDEYIATGKPVRPADIARRLTEQGTPMSEDRVRRHIRKNHGFVAGCSYHEVEIPTYSKSYRGMQHGVVKAAAYLPDRETLRRLIIASR